ncbi:hypothetical protein ACFO9E_05765 [Streptomyces maoxianensis]|uniref:Uncharacterized protein n=1 Tax=Streptomyces maoxianensis TaxID=1459942 RepID=A0ABV9G085_9ACTN
MLQLRREALDQVEEPLPAGRDVSAVLDVVGGPEPLGSGVVPLVEQSVESFTDDGFVPVFDGAHGVINFYLPRAELLGQAEPKRRIAGTASAGSGA